MQIQISWLTDLDLDCLQNRVYSGSAGQGLIDRKQFLHSMLSVNGQGFIEFENEQRMVKIFRMQIICH